LDLLMKAGNGCVSIPTSFYGNDGTKFPEKSAFDPRSVVVNNAGTMKRKLSGQKLAVPGAGTLGGIFLRAYLKQGLFRQSV
jgi:hypothetical protein